MSLLKLRMKPYIQPFEKKLAEMELTSISESSPQLTEAGDESPIMHIVQSKKAARILAQKLSYWEFVQGSKILLTDQLLRESTVNVIKNGVSLEKLQEKLPFSGEIPVPNRRCLRYGPHGIHEYRGKFFPQLVRSLINIGGVEQNSIVADPMCGSGTSAVETILMGHIALCMDINPLSVLITRTKCEILRVQPKELKIAYEKMRDKLMSLGSNQYKNNLYYFHSLPLIDQKYLLNWFSKQSLSGLDSISTIISSQHNGPIKNLFWLSLSNIIRKVSWQKNDDLRVRKEKKHGGDIDPINEFLNELGRSVRFILAFLYQEKSRRFGKINVRVGDGRKICSVWNAWENRVDAVITSPPYAMALPYLDTDRLSLIYLGLLTRSQHRKYDYKMIGNREISERQRVILWENFQRGKLFLPSQIVDLIEKIDRLNSAKKVGFRRKNLPSLLSKYFLDMWLILEGIKKILKPKAPAFLVVGSNHTIAGGTRVEIETASNIALLAETIGFDVVDSIPMEMLVSRDIFKKNRSDSEYILCLKQPS